MAVVTNVEAEAGFQVMIRWFARASQRYPANENEYYFTSFPQLEPGEVFALADPNFVLADINDDDSELEYVIRDLCYVQTLVPQFVGFTYWQPDYRERLFLTAPSISGATSIEVSTDAGFAFAVNDQIVIGPRPDDLRTITAISGNTLTFAVPLTRPFVQSTAVNSFPVVSTQFPNNPMVAIDYPDISAAATIARVFDNDGNLVTEPVEVNTPIFFDTSETVRRYYYSSTLNQPVNGARGPGDTVDTMVEFPEGSGTMIAGGWWAFGDADNTAANRGVLIDAQGFSLDIRDADHAFTLQLFFSATEVGACTSNTPVNYYGNHSNWRGAGDAGTTSIINVDGSIPPRGYYSWISTLAGDAGQRYTKFWSGLEPVSTIPTTGFLAGFLAGESGVVDNCPLALTTSAVVTLYPTEQDLVCNIQATGTQTVYYDPIAGRPNSFGPNNVSAIYTSEFGANSGTNTNLGIAFIAFGGQFLVWNGTNLTISAQTCLNQEYCGDPSALNTGSGPASFRNDALCAYPRQICAIEGNANYIAPANRLGTDIINNATCTAVTPPTTYTARFTATNLITGPREGYQILGDTVNGVSGDPWSIGSVARLNTGYEWVTEPSPNLITRSGTFPPSVVETRTFTGEVRRSAVAVVPGCNNQMADNFILGADGTQACYFRFGNAMAKGTSDLSACENTSRTTQLHTSSNDNLFREGTGRYDTFSLGALAEGWYSDGNGARRYSGGSVLERADSCPAATRFTSLTAAVNTDVVQGGTFSISLNWAGASLPATLFYRVVINGVTSIGSVSSSATGGSGRTALITNTGIAGASVRGSVTIGTTNTFAISRSAAVGYVVSDAGGGADNR